MIQLNQGFYALFWVVILASSEKHLKEGPKMLDLSLSLSLSDSLSLSLSLSLFLSLSRIASTNSAVCDSCYKALVPKYLKNV